MTKRNTKSRSNIKRSPATKARNLKAKQDKRMRQTSGKAGSGGELFRTGLDIIWPSGKTGAERAANKKKSIAKANALRKERKGITKAQAAKKATAAATKRKASAAQKARRKKS